MIHRREPPLIDAKHMKITGLTQALTGNTLIGLIFVLACTGGENRQSSADARANRAQGTERRSHPTKACIPVISDPESSSGHLAPHALAGEYALTAMTLDRAAASLSVSGTLRLDTTSVAPHVVNSVISFPLRGSSDINLAKIGLANLSYSPSSVRQDAPGVQVIHDAAGPTYSMVFGNAFSPGGVRRDAGAYFQINYIRSDSMGGIWSSGGRSRETLHGYFCARRIR